MAAIPTRPDMPMKPFPEVRPFKTDACNNVYCMDCHAKRWYPNPEAYGS